MPRSRDSDLLRDGDSPRHGDPGRSGQGQRDIPRPSRTGWFVHGFVFPLRMGRSRNGCGDDVYGSETGYGRRGGGGGVEGEKRSEELREVEEGEGEGGDLGGEFGACDFDSGGMRGGDIVRGEMWLLVVSVGVVCQGLASIARLLLRM